MELCFQPVFAATARVAIDLNLFRLIADSPTPTSAASLASSTGAAEALIIRILRPLSYLGFVEESGTNLWLATSITTAMCTPPIEAAHIHFWDQGTTSATKLPEFLRLSGYQEPADSKKGVLQYAFGIDQDAFEHWHRSCPDVIANFNTAMQWVRGSRPSWVHWWPVETRILRGAVEAKDSVLLVDIAGGMGHFAREFRAKYPDSPGRVILEDLPAVIDSVSQGGEEIELVKYDFFTPQPIRSARVYYFHFIMHDWSDEMCLRILANTAGAMEKGYSKLLLNEFILPDEECPPFLSGFDLEMMTCHAGKERTESQWKELLHAAGLKVTMCMVPDKISEGVIEAELA
ncbi:S-adenosyl-L-methionine-dependent methyltransferase [Xylariaceae sp. FL0804]|nr:S-adenosyl-L-methionine-dependent methyltransferase [Xylariaceae sp. FL0804]